MKKNRISTFFSISCLSLCLNLSAGQHNRNPAIYFYDFYANKYNSDVVRELLEAGFEINKNKVDYPQNRWLLKWEEMKKYNVIVLVGMPNNFNKKQAELLDRFMKEGGGILMLPIGTNSNDWKPSRWYLQKLGLEVFAEQIKNPEKKHDFKAAQGRLTLPIAWTDKITANPVTRGVKNIWYPLDRGSQYYGTAPLWLNKAWIPLVKTGGGAYTTTKADGDSIHSEKKEVDEYSNFKGRKGDFTIAAIRNYEKGRLGAISLNPQLLFWGGYIPAYNGVLMKTGAQERPSDWSKLIINMLRYLAEPSSENRKLGGYVTDKETIFSKEPGDPTTDFRENLQFPPVTRKTLIGIAGAHSNLSTGKKSVKEWGEAARKAGYDFLVFADDMKKMNAEKWMLLRKQCKENSDNSFLAFPGIEFEAEIGDRGFYLDDLGYWPSTTVINQDGRVRSSMLKGDKFAKMTLNFRSDMKLPPGLTTWYGKQLPMGHFSHKTNPTPYWNHNLYQVMSIFTRENNKILDNWSINEFLEVNAQNLHIAPFALNMMTDTKELPKSFAKGYGYLVFPGTIKQLYKELNKLGSYQYNGLNTPVSVSDGPLVKQWRAVGSLAYILPRWASGPKDSDFYKTPNYRMRLRLVAESEAGIKEVVIYNSMKIWRRFLPDGEKKFEITLDVLNDKHNHFIAVITDNNSRKAVTSEIETESFLNRVYWCADRCNFASRPHVHSAGVMNPVNTTMMSTERTLLNRWTFPFWGPDCGLVQGNVETMFAKGAYPDNGWVSYFDTEPIPQFTWINKEYWWYQNHGRRYVPQEDYMLQGWDQLFTWEKPPSGQQPFYPYNEKEDIFIFKKKVTFASHDVWSIKPIINWAGNLAVDRDSEYDFSLGDKRITGKIPRDGKDLNLSGKVPYGSIFSLRLHTGEGNEYQKARAGTVIIYADNLYYKLAVDYNGKRIKFNIGWQENGKTVPAGTIRKARRFIVANPGPIDENYVFAYRLQKEFLGPGAGFSAKAIDLLRQAKWYKIERGTVVDKMLPLGIKADNFAAQVFVPKIPFPVNSLPVTVYGLNPHWTAFYYEFGNELKKRPVPVSPEGQARVQFDRQKKNIRIWVGHPVVCDNKNIRFSLIDAGEGKFIIEANNVNEQDIEAVFRAGVDCPFLKFKPFKIKIKAGEHLRFETELKFTEVTK